MENLSSRYAQALFSLAKEENDVEKYRVAAKEFNNILDENEDFVKTIGSAFLEKEKREEMVNKIVSSFELPLFANFISVIIENNRTYELQDILKEFNSLCNEYRGVDEGIIYSTYRISEEEKENIEKAISNDIGKNVELHNRIDSTLIGGVKVVISDRVYDGSISNKLSNMKRDLLK